MHCATLELYIKYMKLSRDTLQFSRRKYVHDDVHELKCFTDRIAHMPTDGVYITRGRFLGYILHGGFDGVLPGVPVTK